MPSRSLGWMPLEAVISHELPPFSLGAGNEQKNKPRCWPLQNINSLFIWLSKSVSRFCLYKRGLTYWSTSDALVAGVEQQLSAALCIFNTKLGKAVVAELELGEVTVKMGVTQC